MKIKILKNDAFCLAEFKNDRYEIGHVCVDDCCFDQELHNYLKNDSIPKCCITQSIGIEERFFFNMTFYHNKKQQEECAGIGYITKVDNVFVFNIEKIIAGNKLYPESHHKFLITTYFPSQNFFTSDFNRSILTSDGVITLEDDQLIGVRDGNIEELDVSEVLTMLSKGKIEKSPLYRQVRIQSSRTRPSRPVKGTIIYNEVSDEFEVYGKNGWRKINTENI